MFTIPVSAIDLPPENWVSEKSLLRLLNVRADTAGSDVKKSLFLYGKKRGLSTPFFVVLKPPAGIEPATY
jgi:hypothetical protein